MNQYNSTLLPAYQASDIILVKCLRNFKFTVHLVSINSKNYALKVFPYNKDNICPHYRNESRFGHLRHPNIITFHDTQDLKASKFGKASYILMEYAPYSDFLDLINTCKLDETLVRTYFHQLIAGIEYLHEQKVAHLDLKPDNVLLGEDFNLKIIDFDLAYQAGDNFIMSRGTKHLRAPEMVNGDCLDPYAADIFSAGIFLFLMMTQGRLPYKEDQLSNGLDLFELLQNNSEAFWEFHSLKENEEKFSSELKWLITGMLKLSPEERLPLCEIKCSDWFLGNVYSKSELSDVMKYKLRLH